MNTVVVEGSDWGAGVVFVDDPVSVGGDPLLGRRVEVVRAGVVFVGRPELYRMFLRENGVNKTWVGFNLRVPP